MCALCVRYMCVTDSQLLVACVDAYVESVCGPVNPCWSAVSVPLPPRVNIGLTTCNDILSYACLTPKEPHPLCSSECVWGCSFSLYLLLSFLHHSTSALPPFLSLSPPTPLLSLFSTSFLPLLHLTPSPSLPLLLFPPPLTQFQSLCGPEGLPTSLLSSLPV